jgi:hypothetical protein
MEDTFFLLLFEIDGIGGTDLFTETAFAVFKVDAVIRIDGILERYGLRIIDVDGLSFGKTGIKFVGYLLGTFLGAFPTGNTLLHIHIPGMLEQLNLEITGGAAD